MEFFLASWKLSLLTYSRGFSIKFAMYLTDKLIIVTADPEVSKSYVHFRRVCSSCCHATGIKISFICSESHFSPQISHLF